MNFTVFTSIFLTQWLPLIFYFVAYLIPNKKVLAIYSLFWLTILLISLFDLRCNDFSLWEYDGLWAKALPFIFSIFFPSIFTATVGIIGKAYTFVQRNRNNEIRLPTVHMICLLSILIVGLEPINGFLYIWLWYQKILCGILT